MGSEIGRRDPVSLEALDPSKEIAAVQVDHLVQQSDEYLAAAGRAYAAEYARIYGHPTLLLKHLAAVQLAARIRLDDIPGRSSPYKALLAEMYSGIQMPAEDLDRMKATVRYHLNNLIRRVLTARQLRSHGLLDTAPVERGRDARETTRVLVQAATASIEAASETPTKRGRKGSGKTSDAPVRAGKVTADHLRLATVAASILGQIDADVAIQHMTDGQRKALDAKLAEAEKALRALRRHLKTGSSGT
ncbi:hypothetical protein [Streptomyces sp. CAU 1734]|uniref:hypothetical protein n=1 Tax=Streptomyces sp. CAU 1734 TaxID=3140360 RepID=UPI003261028F